MATILALESSAEACSVALLRGGNVTQLFELAPRQHTRLLLPMVDQLLAEAECDLACIDAFAFGAGPGSFTGLRIAVGIVQGLAFANDKPVVSVPSLQALALTAQREASLATGQLIAVAVDARMDEIYWATFRCNDEGVDVVSEVGIKSLADLPSLDEPFVAVGSGWALPELSALANNAVTVLADLSPQARDLLPIALSRFESGQVSSAAEAVPEYVRNTVSWKKLSEQ